MMSISTTYIPKHDWMIFVDGENLTLQLSKEPTKTDLRLTECEYYQENFVWLPNKYGYSNLDISGQILISDYATRAFYYASYVGNEETESRLRKQLRYLGFEPRIFKKDKPTQKSKGVDITLCTDILSNAYNNNFKVCVLIAGDGDYIPLIKEVKRTGKIVYVSFIRNGLSPNLELEADNFIDLLPKLKEAWTTWHNDPRVKLR